MQLNDRLGFSLRHRATSDMVPWQQWHPRAMLGSVLEQIPPAAPEFPCPFRARLERAWRATQAYIADPNFPEDRAAGEINHREAPV